MIDASTEAESAQPETDDFSAENTSNLAELLKDEERESAVKRALKDWDNDKASRKTRIKRIKEYLELYASVMKAKSQPFANAANINLPILSYAILQTQARLLDMIWPANGKLVSSSPANASDVARGEMTELFSNSYIRHNIPEMGPSIDRMLMQLLLCGSAFLRVYWDDLEERVRCDWIPIEDFVVNHKIKKTDPSMRGIRQTLTLRMTVFELEAEANKGNYDSKAVDGLSSSDTRESEDDEEVNELADKIDGVDDSTEDDDDSPRLVIEQHRWMRTPKRPKEHPSFDGKPHAVILTIDVRSKKLLRMVVREEDDPSDTQRYQQDKLQHDADMATWREMAIVSAQLLTPPPPKPPEPRTQRTREIPFFTHFTAFPSEGFYALGYGDLIGPMNKGGNTLLNQHIDGITLTNCKPALASSHLKGPRGNISFSPGNVTYVDAPPSALADGIKWLEPPPNDPNTMPLIGMVTDLADKIHGSSDVMSGQPQKSNHSARETMIRTEQAMMPISVLARRVHESMRHVYEKMWRLFGVFMPDRPRDLSVITETGKPLMVPISREMFTPDAHVVPAADPRQKWEKLDDAMMLMGFVTQNPLLAQNPAVMMAATEAVLSAQNAPHIIEAMRQAQQPPPPPQPMQPFQENANFLRGKDSPVLPTDEDDHHINEHLAFGQSPEAQAMERNGRAMLETHVRFHLAQRLEKQSQPPPPPPMMMEGMPPEMGEPPMMDGPMPGPPVEGDMT